METTDVLSLTNILAVIIMAAISFIFKVIFGRMDKMETVAKERMDTMEATAKERTDKLEENSRRDGDAVEKLIDDSEERINAEMDRRIANVVELHAKIERDSIRITDKYESNLKDIHYLRGRVDCIQNGK